jgi:hypothetical protein
MATAFKVETYDIETLVQTNQIYIRVVCNTTNISYEGMYLLSDIDLPVTTCEKALKVLNNCLKGVPDYGVEIMSNTETIKLDFKGIIGEITDFRTEISVVKTNSFGILEDLGSVPVETLPSKMFKLLTKPTQFTKGKTEEALSDLTQRYILNNDPCVKYHIIDIIVTNNSLPETEQWKIRTAKQFSGYDDITIDILSSKSTDYTSIDKYISDITRCAKRSELPNILIMCYHSKRVCEDLVRLFNSFNGASYVKAGNIKFHISFDEPDANLNVTKRFIDTTKRFIESKLILGVVFITATPFNEFWEMLKSCGITRLLNMTYENTETYGDEFTKELENYRSFTDHNIIDYDLDTKNPLTYIEEVFSMRKITVRGATLGNIDTIYRKPIEYNPEELFNCETNCFNYNQDDFWVTEDVPVINPLKRNIIFAPAHLTRDMRDVGSHRDVVEFFIRNQYCVFLMNGTFKGFIYPDSTNVKLEDFNRVNNISDELRVSLKIWSEQNPTMNLAITGYLVIERGITFNTTGFNFTHMILSKYHTTSMNKLIQLAGRATGGKKYVTSMDIICTPDIKTAIVTFAENLKEICTLNPQYFNKTDFEHMNSSIPVKLVCSDEVIKQIIEIRGDKRRATRGYKFRLTTAINDGIAAGTITVHDMNNRRTRQLLSDMGDIRKQLNTVRMYTDGDTIDARRFRQLNDAFDTCKCMSQSCVPGNYNIDFAKDLYVNNGFIHNPNVVWVTYSC